MIMLDGIIYLRGHNTYTWAYVDGKVGRYYISDSRKMKTKSKMRLRQFFL